MATASNSKSLYSNSGSTAWTLSIEWTQGTQNVTNNTTSISATAKLKSSSGSFSGGGGTLYIDWYDTKTNSWSNGKGSTSTTSMSAGSSISKTVTFTVTHNADGTLSGQARARWVRSSNDWTPNSGNVSTSSKALTTIARASVPIMGKSSYNVGDTITINTNRASSSFTHTISITVGGTAYTLFTKTTTASPTWQATASSSPTLATILGEIPSAKSTTVTVTVTTYNGSTSLGSKTCTFTYNVPSTYAPTLSSYGITETNTALTASGVAVAGDAVIKNLSKKTVSVKATAGTGTTISSVKFTNGSTTKTATLASGVYSASFATSELTSATFSYTATDARGYSATGSSTGTLVSYAMPAFNSANIEHPNATTSTADISAAGTWFKGTIGSKTNTLTAKYSIDGATAVTFTSSELNSSSNIFTIAKSNIAGVSVDAEHTCVITLTDAFNTVSLTLNLASATPVLWMGKNTVRLNKHLIIEGTDSTISMGDDGELSTIDYAMFAKLASRGVWRNGTLASTTGGVTVLPDAYGVYLVATHSHTNGLENTLWLVRPAQNIAFKVGEGFLQQSSGVTFASGYQQYSGSSINLTRNNGVVSIRIYASPTSAVDWGSTQATICTLPAIFAPCQEVVALMQGTGKANWRMVINTNGTVTGARYGTTANATVPSGAWLNINATYIGRADASYSPVSISVSGSSITATCYTGTAYVQYMKIGDYNA